MRNTRKEIITATMLGFFLALPAVCFGQIPTPTITATPTPATTVTPAPSNLATGPIHVSSPSPTPTAVPYNGEPAFTSVPEEYQPPSSGHPQSGQHLDWVEYQPSGTGVDGLYHWPVVVILHIGGYHNGSSYDAFHNAPQDLNAAGFYVVVADWPLAPPHSIAGQNRQDTDPASGRPPQQTKAVEAIIRAAAGHQHCYHGLVGVLGGSSGAGHGAFAALDVRNDGTNWPSWSYTQRPKCVFCLSGQYDFAERDLDVYDSARFILNTENYINSTVPSVQHAASPVALVGPLHTSGYPLVPMYFFRASDDPGSPKSQAYYMWNTLKLAGYDPSLYRMWDVPPSSNADHAFALWDDVTGDTYPITTLKVKDRAIGFFRQYLHD